MNNARLKTLERALQPIAPQAEQLFNDAEWTYWHVLITGLNLSAARRLNISVIDREERIAKAAWEAWQGLGGERLSKPGEMFAQLMTGDAGRQFLKKQLPLWQYCKDTEAKGYDAKFDDVLTAIDAERR